MSVSRVYDVLLRYALWRIDDGDIPQQLSHNQYLALKSLSEEQTTVGLISQALIDKNVSLEEGDVANVLSLILKVKQLNQRLNQAVVNLCQLMDKQGIRILILKGQTYATFYPDPSLRQCGDIDFICHPDDMEKAVAFLKYDLGLTLSHSGSNKHAGFVMDGIKYEIHRLLTNFAYPSSHRYWEKVYMKEVWEHPYTISVDDYPVPTLAPTYNAVYVFEHIFFHLIMDGIGIRQYCDWCLLLHHYRDDIDRDVLYKHLKGIRLYKAYVKSESLLVDYLGLPEAELPFETYKDRKRHSDSILHNLLYMGNFGHNVSYFSSHHGLIHGLEHLMRIARQGLKYISYAPMEVLWRIPYMLKWWTMRIVRTLIPCKSIQSVFKRV